MPLHPSLRFSPVQIIIYALCLFMATTITGCASTTSSHQTPTLIQEHIENISQNWNYPFTRSGRFSAQLPNHSQSKNIHVRFMWDEKNGSDLELTFSDPIGGTIGVFTKTDANAQLTLADGQSFKGSQSDEVFQRATGLDLSVNAVRYWLRGIPTPHQPFEINPKDTFGWIQNGWYVRIDDWHIKNNQVKSPKTIIANRLQPPVSIRMTVSE